VRQLILAPGEGLSVENPVGGLFTFKVTSDESGGTLTAIETLVVRPEGPPLHVHEQDEVIYTLAGSLRVKLGDVLREAPAGSFVFIPRGHAAHLAERRSRTAALLRDDHAGGC
jgi:quercetin dioxygenase-like cupin family protein